MPNWCNNFEYIYGPTKSIEELYRKLDYWIKRPKDNPSGETNDNWIGNVFINAGFDLEKEEMACRCWLVEWFDLYNDEYSNDIARIEFSSESAWEPIYELWDKFLKEYFPDCKYCFMSEEPGNEIYLKRDPLGVFADSEYVIDFVINEPKYFDKYNDAFNNIDIEEYCGGFKGYLSECDICEMLTSILIANEDMPAKDLIKKFNENVEAGLYGKDNYFGIYKFEEIDENE